MALTPEQMRSINEDLLSQVNAENVLAAAALFQKQADDIDFAVLEAHQRTRLEPCGGDPISQDARDLFQRKIDDILSVHRAHSAELRAAVAALRASAASYGFTELEIARALEPNRIER